MFSPKVKGEWLQKKKKKILISQSRIPPTASPTPTIQLKQ